MHRPYDKKPKLPSPCEPRVVSLDLHNDGRKHQPTTHADATSMLSLLNWTTNLIQSIVNVHIINTLVDISDPYDQAGALSCSPISTPVQTIAIHIQVFETIPYELPPYRSPHTHTHVITPSHHSSSCPLLKYHSILYTLPQAVESSPVLQCPISPFLIIHDPPHYTVSQLSSGPSSMHDIGLSSTQLVIFNSHLP